MAKIYRVIQINTELVSLRKCPYDYRLTNKAYLSGITVTKISRSFYLQDGGKNQLAQIWNKTSRHCHPLYMSFSSERACVPTRLFTLELVTNHRCKKRFYVFYFGHVL